MKKNITPSLKVNITEVTKTIHGTTIILPMNFKIKYEFYC